MALNYLELKYGCDSVTLITHIHTQPKYQRRYLKESIQEPRPTTHKREFSRFRKRMKRKEVKMREM